MQTDMEQFLSELVEAYRAYKESHTKQEMHGPGGVFSTLGADPTVFSTYVRPKSISNYIPLVPSVYDDPRFWILTGFSAPQGSQPGTACADAPTGYTKGCQLTAQFGLKRFDTNQMEMDRLVLLRNRGEPIDLRLIGAPILGGTNLAPSDVTLADAINFTVRMEMLRTAAYMEMALHKDIWQGTAGTSFPGLSVQIATGQVDAETGELCESADSQIYNFNYADVCGAADDIVELLSAMMYYLESLADSTGLSPVKFAVVMRPQLWFELSACWPCAYMTNRCSGSTTVNDYSAITTRDEMRQTNTITINGQAYQVITDTGIFEHNSGNDQNLQDGQFASTIYIVPLTVAGGAFSVCYREYLDYRQAAPQEAALLGRQPWIVTDNGAYSWAYTGSRWCFKLSLKTEQRIVLRAPQLAGAIQKVRYSPLIHLREPDFDSPYHVDGGVSVRPEGTRYAVWLP